MQDLLASPILPQPGKVWLIGAGPGAPDLLTLRGRDLIAASPVCLYAGSLVSDAALQWTSPGCEIADSKGMTLDEITGWLASQARRHAVVVRLQTGDPALYGTLIEMVRPLDAQGVPVAVVPGVSSAMASAAAAVESFTLPEVTQTTIFTRVEGRTGSRSRIVRRISSSPASSSFLERAGVPYARGGNAIVVAPEFACSAMRASRPRLRARPRLARVASTTPKPVDQSVERRAIEADKSVDGNKV